MFKLNENSSVSAAEAIGIRTAVTGRQLSQKVVIMSDLVSVLLALRKGMYLNHKAHPLI